MKWVKLTNNVVTEILTQNPNGLYHPDFIKQCKEAPDNVGCGWIYINETFVKPDNRKPIFDSKMDEIVSKRTTKLNSGVQYNGNFFDSNQQSKDNINGVIQAVNLGWVLPENFVWMSMDNNQISFNENDIKQLALILTDFTSQTYTLSFTMKQQLTELYDSGASEQELLDFKVEF